MLRSETNPPPVYALQGYSPQGAPLDHVYSYEWRSMQPAYDAELGQLDEDACYLSEMPNLDPAQLYGNACLCVDEDGNEFLDVHMRVRRLHKDHANFEEWIEPLPERIVAACRRATRLSQAWHHTTNAMNILPDDVAGDPIIQAAGHTILLGRFKAELEELNKQITPHIPQVDTMYCDYPRPEHVIMPKPFEDVIDQIFR